MIKKRMLETVIVLLCIIVALIAVFIQLKYDVNVVQYVRYSFPFSSEEKQYIKEKKILIYGGDNHAPPFSFVNKETGEYEGLVVDYMDSISIQCGVRIEKKSYSWGQTILSLKNNNIDMVDMFPTKSRAESFSFTQPIYKLTGEIVVREGTDLDIHNLKGKRIGVIRDDFAEEYFRSSYSKETGYRVELRYVNNVNEGLDKILSGDIDALAGDAAVIEYLENKRGDETKFRELGIEIYRKDVAFAVNKDNQVLLGILNKAILQLKRKNVIEQVQRKWFGSDTLIFKNSKMYNYGLLLLIILIATGIIVILWSSLLCQRIEEKTKELRKNQNDLKTIIDSLKLYIMVIDGSEVILDCNSCVAEKLGLPSKQILKRSLREFPLFYHLYRICDSKSTEVHDVSYSGNYYDLRSTNLVSDVPRKLFIVEDVTHKAVIQRKMRQYSKMVAVGHLSAGLAHEIRNPLGLIRNYLYVLRGYVTDDVSEHAVRVSNESVSRINNLVANLLNFSRKNMDRSEAIDLKRFLENIIELEQKELLKDMIDVRVEDNYGGMIWTNSESLKVIFLNILENSIAAFNEVNNRKNMIRFNLQRKGEKVEIKVQDNGCGMNEKTLESMFDPFFTTKETGVGLGMYMVQTEVERLGGEITVESHECEGTMIRIVLPSEEELSR